MNRDTKSTLSLGHKVLTVVVTAIVTYGLIELIEWAIKS